MLAARREAPHLSEADARACCRRSRGAEVALCDPNATDATLRAACERVIAVGEQQERLIEALLTLARSQRGLEAREPLQLDQVLREVLHGVEAGNVRVEAALDEAPTIGDPALIERLAVNLVDNALHYNRPHGWIRVSTGMRNGKATLEVSNAGPAIAADEVELLFEPFRRHRGKRTASSDHSPAGHGLGLSIVRAIADAHRAALTATSGDQGGLRVRVSFQVALPAGLARPDDAAGGGAGAGSAVREPSGGPEPVAGGVRLTA
jgi:signal transduction histidine kinase